MLQRAMVQAKKFIYAKRFEGLPKLTDFRLEEETLPELQDGDVLIEAIYLSVDPYMRVFVNRLPIGLTMIGGQVSKVIDSKNTKYPKDALIYGTFGWRSHTVFNPEKTTDHAIKPYVLPPFDGLPASLALGQLGMPGNTAYFGFLNVCKPKAGDIVVVSAAAGAVGSVVGQIAKIKGCKVIGLTGADSKCMWLTNELGFDYAINYKTTCIADELKKAAPDGIDCYFDNVGGEISSAVINQMRKFGRISVVGSIAGNNFELNDWPKVPMMQRPFINNELTMKGFRVYSHVDKWFTGIEQMRKWIVEGKMKYQETITNGFENMPQALIDMLQGQNLGKAIVKV